MIRVTLDWASSQAYIYRSPPYIIALCHSSLPAIFQLSGSIMVFLKLVSVASFAVTITAFVNRTVCNDKVYTYEELAGVGILPSNGRDEFGDTLGGIGSGLALDRSQWKKLANGSYTGVVWGLPDRGW